MKRLLGFLLLSTLSFGISRTGTVNGATSGTFTATATGDLKIIFAYRNGANTPPTLPAGWTTVNSGGTGTGGTIGSYTVGCNVSSSSADTASGTWTNSTRIIGASYSGTSATSTGTCPTVGIGQTGANFAKASTTMDYPTISLVFADNTSWVVSFGGTSSGTEPACVPAGLTSVLTAGASAIGDSNGTLSSWSDQTCSVGATAETWMSFILEITTAHVAGAGGAQACVFVLCE